MHQHFGYIADIGSKSCIHNLYDVQQLVTFISTAGLSNTDLKG